MSMLRLHRRAAAVLVCAAGLPAVTSHEVAAGHVGRAVPRRLVR